MNTYKTTTDDTLREMTLHGSDSFPFAYYPENIWQFDFHRIDWHWHHELEFVYVAEGTALCRVGMDIIELKKGCGLFINSGILHRFEASESTFIPNIVFSPLLLAGQKSLIYHQYICPVIESAAAFQTLDPHTDWQNRILTLLTRIFSLQESGEKCELQTVMLLFQLWQILFEHLDLSENLPGLKQVNHQQARLQTMMQYIHDHYAEALTLEEISASASISKSSALQIFQSCIRTSPVAYLIQYRLAQAADWLYTTQKSISVIAEEAGFSSPGYFCRKFKQFYGITPNEYRKKRT